MVDEKLDREDLGKVDDEFFDSALSGLSSSDKERDDDVLNLGEILNGGSGDEDVEVLDVPHFFISKREILNFITLVNGLYSMGGDDVYVKSFYVKSEKGKGLRVAYDNGMLHVSALIGTVDNSNRLEGEFMLDIQSIVKVLSSSSGVNVPFLEKDGELFAYIYGGELYVQTYEADMGVYTDFDMGDLGEVSSEFVGSDLVPLLKSMYSLSNQGARVEERAIYFENSMAYVYLGNVLGKFKGKFEDMVLQNSDVSAVINLFKGYEGKIELFVNDVGIVFKGGSSELVLGKKTLELSSEVKSLSTAVDRGIVLDSGVLAEILSIVVASPSSSGIVSVIESDRGLLLNVASRVSDAVSEFPVYANKVGGGLSSKNVKVGVKLLYDYIRVFEGDVLLDIKDEKLYIEGGIGNLLIMGG